MSLLGIDLGITGCEAIAFSEDGKMLARAYREYPLLYPKSGWIELNPNMDSKSCKVGIAIQEIRVAGGGAKSYQWLQLKANIYDKKILSLNTTKAACLGAAILAGLGSSFYSSIEEGIKACVRVKREFYPHRKWAKVYQEKFGLYKTIYPTLQDLNHRITELNTHQ